MYVEGAQNIAESSQYFAGSGLPKTCFFSHSLWCKSGVSVLKSMWLRYVTTAHCMCPITENSYPGFQFGIMKNWTPIISLLCSFYTVVWNITILLCTPVINPPRGIFFLASTTVFPLKCQLEADLWLCEAQWHLEDLYSYASLWNFTPLFFNGLKVFSPELTSKGVNSFLQHYS